MYKYYFYLYFSAQWCEIFIKVCGVFIVVVANFCIHGKFLFASFHRNNNHFSVGSTPCGCPDATALCCQIFKTVVFSVFGVFRALKTFVRICLFRTRHASDKARLCPYGNKGNINDGGTKKGTPCRCPKMLCLKRQFEGLCLFL